MVDVFYRCYIMVIWCNGYMSLYVVDCLIMWLYYSLIYGCYSKSEVMIYFDS